jgi:hypothetical protein
MWRPTRFHVVAAICLALAIAHIPNTAYALIEGGKGNRPVSDPGWPRGAAAIFNHKGRIAWWVADGLPGWHADCRGNAESLNAVLADYAKLDVKTKRLVIHNGLGNSYLLNPNREPKRKAESWIQWTFMVLEKPPANGNRVGRFRRGNVAPGPPTQIDVYTGGQLRWADVKVPEGIVVIDERLEAHGFELQDGIVLKGKLTDLATDNPVAGRIQLQRVETQRKGPHRHTVVATVGEATIRLKKAGYDGPRLGQPVSMPAGGIQLVMLKSATSGKFATLQVTIDFAGKNRPKQYMVDISTAGAGTWGGSGYIDAKDQITFKNVPPGRPLRPPRSSKSHHTSPTHRSKDRRVKKRQGRQDLDSCEVDRTMARCHCSTAGATFGSSAIHDLFR